MAFFKEYRDEIRDGWNWEKDHPGSQKVGFFAKVVGSILVLGSLYIENRHHKTLLASHGNFDSIDIDATNALFPEQERTVLSEAEQKIWKEVVDSYES